MAFTGTMRAPAIRRAWTTSLLAIAVAGLWAPAVSAQQAADDSDEDDTILVTGSRLARSTFDTPQPVTVLGAEELEQVQVTNIGEAVSEIPAFRPSNNPSTNGFGSFNVGAQIVNLRGLGVTRNLVLVDGRRFAPTTREGSVDLNFIPSIMVSRVEVVTGGASAAYGSDALAGVVNVILDTRLEGLKAQIDYGVAEEGDGDNLHAGLAFGTSFGGGRGHFVIGGEYSDQSRVGNCFTRDWCRVGGVVTNNGFAAGNGLPQFVRNDSNAGWFMNPAGVVSRVNNATGIGSTIANSLGTGAITFSPGGAVQASQIGSPASGLSQVGGSLYATYTDVDMIAPVERYTLFSHLDYEVSDAINAFVEGSYGHVDGGTFQAAYFSSSIPIYADNPYIPAAIRAVTGFPAPGQPTGPASLTRPAAATFSLAKVFDDLARGFSRSRADSWRVTAGLDGDLGGGFSWDAYYQYGQTDRLQTVDNNLVVGDPTKTLTNPALIAQSNARFFFAADAVVDPATGRPTCRAVLSTDPALRAAAAGCVPVNLFGAGNVTDAGKAYIYNQLREDIDIEQHVAAVNLRGDTGADILAGPLSFALGAEFREDSIAVLHDPLSNVYAYFQNFGSDYTGNTRVVEGYLEAELPIVEGVPGVESLSLNGAVRQAHYRVSGFGSYLRASARNSFDATTWKVSLNWEFSDWLRLRATQSHDVRAPNFAELFLASASSFTPVLNRFVLSNGAATTNFPSIVSGGSPTLTPEKADTTTLGLVITPTGGLRGVRLSADFYRIRVEDYIGTAPGGTQFLIDRCFAGVAQACGFVDRNPTTGAITTVRNISLNLDEIVARGMDFAAEYRVDMPNDSSLTMRTIATYVDTLRTTSLGDVVNRAGQTGNSAGLAAPDFTLNSTVTYAAPRWSLTLQGRFINSGHYDNQRIGPDDARYATTLPNSIPDNLVDSRFYVNLFGSVFIDSGQRFELFGSVSNLFDKDPPAAPETQFYTNPVYFDTLGRYYRMGVRVKL